MAALWLVHPPVPKAGAKSFANDLVDDRGVVITRAVFSTQFFEASNLSICSPAARTQKCI